MSIQQKPIRLDQPIDHEAPPTIYSTSLKPEFANAALNLTVDFQRQKQSIVNRHLIKHPYSLLVVVLLVGGFGYYKVGWLLQQDWKLIKSNLGEILPVLIFMTMVSSIFFTVISRPSEVIKDRADDLVNSNKDIFGFELKDLITKKDKEITKKSENSSLVVYRDSPIAIVSLVEVPDFKEDTLTLKITGLGVRKVYIKSGIIEDLFDFAKKRSIFLNNKKYQKILILIDALSCDYEFKKLLKSQDFKFIKSQNLSDSKVLNFYNVKNEIWGLPLNVFNDIETIKSKTGATGIK